MKWLKIKTALCLMSNKVYHISASSLLLYKTFYCSELLIKISLLQKEMV